MAGLSEVDVKSICEQQLPVEVLSIGKVVWQVMRELLSAGKLADELWELTTSITTLADLSTWLLSWVTIRFLR